MTPNPNNVTFKAFVMDRVRSFGLVVAIGFLLLVSLAVSAALAALGTWLDRVSPGMPLLWNAVNVIVSLAVITALFTLLYLFLPDIKLRCRDVVVGAFVAAVLFTIGKQHHECEVAGCGKWMPVPVIRKNSVSPGNPILRSIPAAAAQS